MKRLRVVADLPLTYRCDEDFAAMTPVPGGRRCAACDRVVHDLSAMSARDAARFVAAHRGERTCYRYLARPDGTMVFAPEPARPLAPLTIAAALAACTPHGEPLAQQLVEATPDPIPALAPPVVIPTASPTPVVAEPCQPPDPAQAAPARPKKPKKPPATRPKDTLQYVGFEG